MHKYVRITPVKDKNMMVMFVCAENIIIDTKVILHDGWMKAKCNDWQKYVEMKGWVVLIHFYVVDFWEINLFLGWRKPNARLLDRNNKYIPSFKIEMLRERWFER